MAAAFQANAFQNTAFQTSIIASTSNLKLPINCVLIGQQELYKSIGRTFQRIPGRSGQRIVSRASSVQSLGDAPSFTIKSNARGYD